MKKNLIKEKMRKQLRLRRLMDEAVHPVTSRFRVVAFRGLMNGVRTFSPTRCIYHRLHLRVDCNSCTRDRCNTLGIVMFASRHRIYIPSRSNERVRDCRTYKEQPSVVILQQFRTVNTIQLHRETDSSRPIVRMID